MKSILTLLLLFSITGVKNSSFAQALFEIQTFDLPENAVWTIDGLDNLIISDKDKLSKYDKDGKLLFEQSQKSTGRFDELGMVNTLKFYAFSESQQSVCFFDNSLTMLDKCIDFSQYDFMNITAVASSSQSDKMWAFDQVNSTLNLLSLKGLQQSQQVKNLNGILDASNITQLLEWENKLFVLDSKKGVYIFDLYGTLMRFIAVKNAKWIQVKEGKIICLMDYALEFYSIEEKPDDVIIHYSFRYSKPQKMLLASKHLYFQQDQKIFKAMFFLNEE